MGLFSLKSLGYLGVDIGTSGVKIVELKKEKNKVKLFSYGFSEMISTDDKVEWQNNPARIAAIINKVYEKAGMTSRDAISSLPNFSVFSSVIKIANVPDKDIESAVRWQAKKVVPLPLKEMILDWVKIQDKEAKKNNKDYTKVLLTAAPSFLVKKYIEIFKLARINLLGLETESLSLIRSLLGNDESITMILDIGSNTTDISIVEKSIPILNRSIDVGGESITKTISQNLNISLRRAEQFKYDLGISSMNSKEEVVPKIIVDAIAPIIDEIKYTLNLFQSKNQKDLERVILSGGGSLLANFPSYLAKSLNKQVVIGDPWFRVSYPVELEPTLKELSPQLAVAVGLAMREM